jgi:hypothetical protein
LGSLRSEGCSIVVFAEDIGVAAGKWTAALRRGAKADRTIAGREIFVFPSTSVRNRWARAKPWEGTFLVLLKPDGTVVLACSARLGKDTLWFGWQIYRLQAFEVFLDAR